MQILCMDLGRRHLDPRKAHHICVKGAKSGLRTSSANDSNLHGRASETIHQIRRRNEVSRRLLQWSGHRRGGRRSAGPGNDATAGALVTKGEARLGVSEKQSPFTHRNFFTVPTLETIRSYPTQGSEPRAMTERTRRQVQVAEVSRNGGWVNSWICAAQGPHAGSFRLRGKPLLLR